jgi:hypothetical protein
MPVTTTPKKTHAEILFENYLSQHGMKWEYEALSGRTKPDYAIPCASGKCVIEVKQIQNPNPPPAGGYNPGRFVRAKIQRARKQLREYKDHPCSLAIYSDSIFASHSPSTVLSAAFGPGFQHAGRDYSRIDPSPSFYRFFKRSELPPERHFLANALLSPTANTTFSALIALIHYQLSELHLEVWRRLYAMQEAGQMVNPQDQFRLLNELGPALNEKRRFEGTVRVIVIENRYGRIPFPQELFRGPFDQRWGWQGDLCGPVWLGSTLDDLYGQGVPFHML